MEGHCRGRRERGRPCRGDHLTTAAPRLRAIFAGTAEFSVPSLRATARVTDLIAVVTQPDRPGHRGRPAPRPVADAAEALGVPVLQPEKVRSAEATAELLALGADVLVVAAYGQILPARLLEGFRLGGVNVHASVLPRWRGAAPINAAITNGDTETGVSIMRMEAGLDTGPVYRIRSIPLPPDVTASQLTHTLAELGAGLLADVLGEMSITALLPTPQDESLVTYAPRLTREDGRVVWAERTATEVDRLVRGLEPWPGVSAVLAGNVVRVWRGSVEPGADSAEPGTWAPAPGGGVRVTCAGHTVYRIDECQPAGGRRMAAADYLRGRHAQKTGSTRL